MDENEIIPTGTGIGTDLDPNIVTENPQPYLLELEGGIPRPEVKL